MQIEPTPIFLIVDLFCGFGGTTTGFAKATLNGNKIAKVIACVNHDPKAIQSHWLNHKDVIHFEEDIRTLELYPLTRIVNDWRTIYPEAKLILWASLECTNFSKAKGGQPRNADSRTLAEHLFRYQQALNPDYIKVENVVEFMSWGALDENGKPISKHKGEDFTKWKNEMCSLGYYDEWTQLNSADFGSYTSRNRLFGCFARPGLPIVFPQPTHSKKAGKKGFEDLLPWKAVKEVLNFEDEGESIFTRKKPLSEKTLERIYAGLLKFVANGDISFLSNYKSGHPNSKNSSLKTVSGTLTTVPTQALVQTKFLLKYNSTNGKTGVHHPPSVDTACPTISCQGRLGVVQTKFLSHYYGNGFNTSMEEPCPTLTTKDRVSLIRPQYFLFNPQFNNAGSSIEKPCFTLIAKMDKRPPYLIIVENNEVAIEVSPTDSLMTICIKEFMAAYGLEDIKMRMLRVLELLQIQGFSKDYEMVGTQADQKKFIGNSVEPIVPKTWAEILATTLINQRTKVA